MSFLSPTTPSAPPPLATASASDLALVVDYAHIVSANDSVHSTKNIHDNLIGRKTLKTDQ